MFYYPSFHFSASHFQVWLSNITLVVFIYNFVKIFRKWCFVYACHLEIWGLWGISSLLPLWWKERVLFLLDCLAYAGRLGTELLGDSSVFTPVLPQKCWNFRCLLPHLVLYMGSRVRFSGGWGKLFSPVNFWQPNFVGILHVWCYNGKKVDILSQGYLVSICKMC